MCVLSESTKLWQAVGVKKGRISQTALKVALGLITLSVKDDWVQRLPAGLVELSEHLLLASG